MHARSIFASLIVSSILLASSGLPVSAADSPTTPAVCSGEPSAINNTLETQEFHVRNARLPGIVSARQNLTAWHVTQGSWKGQVLDGLFIVLVQTVAEDGTSARSTNCYVSHDATPAQRDALVGAFLASNSQLLSSKEAAGLRIEPGVISIEIAGQNVVLHLGLVA